MFLYYANCSGLPPIGICFTDVALYGNHADCLGGAAALYFAQDYAGTFLFDHLTVLNNTVNLDSYSCFAQGFAGSGNYLTLSNSVIANNQYDLNGDKNCWSHQFADGGANYQYPNDPNCTKTVQFLAADPEAAAELIEGECVVPYVSLSGTDVPDGIGQTCNIQTPTVTDYVREIISNLPVVGPVEINFIVGINLASNVKLGFIVILLSLFILF